ncbi:hypothetical protein [Marinobacterium stanieri]|uniref:hypothetical protein n=1 Tax=Marinobacterium stanieri TaxID=49186 RepID=UPI0002F94770|nr:hypothetical protein [Marinobacterium stanieri]
MSKPEKIACELFVYDVTRCGLYIGRKPEPTHLPIGPLLKEIKQWAIDSEKPIIETSTYTKNHRTEESYCLDMVSSNGQYLLALWNKVPHSKSGVGMINGSKAASSAKVSHTKIGNGDIPGYPTFFWFLPSSNKMIAIKIESPALGISQLREYIKGYLYSFCSYRVINNIDGKITEGFADFPRPPSGKDERVVNLKLHPSISIVAKSVPGKQDEFLARYDQVTKLVKDIYVYNSLSDNNATMLERVRSFFNDLPASRKKKARVQMPVSLSKTDMQGFIDEYNNNDHSQEHDVGFIFSGSQHIDWLSGSQQKIKELLDIHWIAEGQPDLKKLLESLRKIENLIALNQVNVSGDSNEKAV